MLWLIRHSTEIKKNEITIIVLLFLFGMSFLNLANYYLLSIFMIGLILVIQKGKVYVNLEIFWVIAFLISFLVLDYFINDSNSIYRVAIWTMMYFAGNYIMFENDKGDKLIPLYMLALSFGFLVHAFLSVYFTPPYIGRGRYIYDFWTMNLKNATHIGAWCIPIVSLLTFSVNNKSKLIKAIVLLGNILVLIINFEIGQRTAIFIICIMLLYTLYKKLTSSLRNMIKTLVVLLLIIMVIFIVYYLNFFGLKEFVQQSILYQRLVLQGFPLKEEPRFQRQLYAVSHFGDSFFGGYAIRSQVGQLHNLWLDLYDMVGFLPFLFIVLFTISNIRNLFKIVKNKYVTHDLKNALVGWFLCLLLQFNFEPVLEYGDGKIFGAYLFICGCINSYKYIMGRKPLLSKPI